MKGRLLLNGECQYPVHIACDHDLITIYRTSGNGIEVLYTLIRGRLLPSDENEIILEGFIRKSGDPEEPEAISGEEYLFTRFSFYPETLLSLAAFSDN
ncbi:MAG: hypothetical protein RIF32_12265 [Leptospirales bacterium]